MKILQYTFLLLLVVLGKQALAQRIVYSEPDREDNRRINFEIIGKIGGNFHIYKNIRGKNYISLYNNDMVQVSREEHDYIPDDRLINVDFFAYPDFSYMVYQYQRRNVVYCNAVKVDAAGKKASDIITLDTTHIGFATNNKIYSVVNSEDRSKLLISKINSRNRTKYIVTTILFDNELTQIKRSQTVLPMEERDDYLGEFSVDNEGDLVFTKFSRNNNDNITKTWFIWKGAQSDSFVMTDISKENLYLDELHVKVDNVNKRYFLTSFYYKQRRGNIEGMYFMVWDKATAQPSMINTVELGEEIRREARGDANIRMAFNDYFIRDIIIKRDGGFIIGNESYYTTSRFNNWNRWNYLYGMPFSSALDYYSYSPLYNSWYWRNRYGSNQAVRHHADNITILSFDNTGKLQWSNVIHKEQFDDETGDRISYKLMNTGGELHFLFNQEEKRAQLLTDYTLTPGGEMNRNPTLKNLDRGFEFMPKYAKQVSGRQMIIPCLRNNYICFAKLDFNQ
jgi:hypothetical protein